jgi:hypothetical protein
MVVQVASWDEGPFLRVFTSFRAHCGLIISLLLSTVAVKTRGRGGVKIYPHTTGLKKELELVVLFVVVKETKQGRQLCALGRMRHRARGVNI